METGTRAQCFNAPEGATERANKSKKREKRKPAAHSPEDTHFLSVSLTQHPGGRGGWGPHTHFPHYPRIKAREIIVRIIKEGNLKKKKLHFLPEGHFPIFKSFHWPPSNIFLPCRQQMKCVRNISTHRHHSSLSLLYTHVVYHTDIIGPNWKSSCCHMQRFPPPAAQNTKLPNNSLWFGSRKTN